MRKIFACVALKAKSPITQYAGVFLGGAHKGDRDEIK